MKKFKANDNKSEEHEINYRQFNKKLELLNQILSLISDINQASDEIEVKDCIPALLQYTGEYTDADRVYIFELMSEKQDYYSNTFEWSIGLRSTDVEFSSSSSLSVRGYTGQNFTVLATIELAALLSFVSAPPFRPSSLVNAIRWRPAVSQAPTPRAM